MRRPAQRRAFVLWEITVLLALAAMLALLLGRMVVDAIYVQRIATQHANRVLVIDDLLRVLRQDALHAVGHEWRGQELVLHTVTHEGARDVVYLCGPNAVRRAASDGDERVWQAVRLEFAWRVERGPNGDFLRLDFHEVPPPRASIAYRQDLVAGVWLRK